MKMATVTIRLRDIELVEDILSFCWHQRDCDAIDADGEWRIGNAPCDCGYDELMERLDRPTLKVVP